MSTFELLGQVEEEHGDLFLVDEVDRRYIIPGELASTFNVGDRVVCQIFVPLSASICWDGRVVRLLSDRNPEDYVDSALTAPPHPVVRDAWEAALESDRNAGYTDLYKASIEVRSASGVPSSYGFECRSRTAAGLVIEKHKEVFPDDCIQKVRVDLHQK